MKTAFLKLTLVLLIGTSIISSCKKDEARPNPTISYLTDEGYTFSDTTLSAGDTVRIGLKCEWNGTDLLTSINLFANDNLTQTITISPASESGTVSFTIPKSGVAREHWVFELVDANGQKADLSLTLTKETSGGALNTLADITIGAQNNTTTGGFYAPSNNMVYNEPDAATHQGIIDIIGAYNADNEIHLASPGANLKGIYDLANWTTKNTTYFCAMNISVDQYNFIDSDKFIIDSYEGFATDDRKRKAKKLKENDIYVFKTEAGKYGILKVGSVTDGETGSVTFDVKIQQ